MTYLRPQDCDFESEVILHNSCISACLSVLALSRLLSVITQLPTACLLLRVGRNPVQGAEGDCLEAAQQDRHHWRYDASGGCTATRRGEKA